jgi:lipopolysaccharide transport system ATP-binding protein
VGAIWALCDKALFMDRGEIRVAGSVEAVIRAYQDENATVNVTDGSIDGSPREDSEEVPADYSGSRGGTGDAVVMSVFCFRLSLPNVPVTVFDFREGFGIEALVKVRSRVSDPLFRFTINAAHYRFIVTLDSFEQGFVMKEVPPGTYRIRVAVEQQNFTPGAYSVNASIVSKGFAGHLFFWNNAAQFQIKNPPDRFFYSEPNAVMYLNGQFAIDECDDSAVRATRDDTGAQQGEKTRSLGR